MRVFILCLWLILPISSLEAKINIIASTADLSSIAEFIGGDKVSVSFISPAKGDHHTVELRPSYMVKTAKADIYLKVGLSLDYWADDIINGSRNSKLKVIDCSRGIEALEIPQGSIDRSQGDIHPEGNPHYWLDPHNGLIIAQNIRTALQDIDQSNSDYYADRYENFLEQLETKLAVWRKKMEAFRGIEIITYHKSWSYFAKVFDLKVVGFIEPFPGIEPTPSHTKNIIDLVNERNIKVIAIEPFYPYRSASVIANTTGASIAVIPLSVKGAENAENYFKLFDVIINNLLKALKDAP